MKYLWLLLLIPMLASADVDLAVKGVEYWQDGKPTADWTREQFIEFWRQTHKGEIVDVFPVGHSFGTNVKVPKIIRITVTGVTVEQARTYLEPLIDSLADPASDTTFIKEKRFFFRRAVIDSAIALWEADSSHITLTKAQAKNLLIEWDKATIKQKIMNRLQR